MAVAGRLVVTGTGRLVAGRLDSFRDGMRWVNVPLVCSGVWILIVVDGDFDDDETLGFFAWTILLVFSSDGDFLNIRIGTLAFTFGSLTDFVGLLSDELV